MNSFEKNIFISFAKHFAIIYAGIAAFNFIRLIPKGILAKTLRIGNEWSSNILEQYETFQLQHFSTACMIAAATAIVSVIANKK